MRFPKRAKWIVILILVLLESMMQKVVINEAQRRLRLTMLALLDYRLHNKRFPTTLAELSPPAPLDPFINRPLHYRRTASEFLLYSVGVNLIDDGGNAVPPQKGDPPPDIVVSIP